MDHLTFSAAVEATFGLPGPNGVGKSTLIKMLATLLPDDCELTVRFKRRAQSGTPVT